MRKHTNYLTCANIKHVNIKHMMDAHSYLLGNYASPTNKHLRPLL